MEKSRRRFPHQVGGESRAQGGLRNRERADPHDDGDDSGSDGGSDGDDDDWG